MLSGRQQRISFVVLILVLLVSMSSLFPSHCGLPVVPEVDFRFIGDCTVRGAPPPILECPVIDIPFDPPPPPPPPCPQLSVSTAGTVTYGDNPCDSAAFHLLGQFIQIHDSCGSCSQELLLDGSIYLPPPLIPCPEIEVDSSVAVTIVNSNQSGGGTLLATMTPGPSDPCSNECHYVLSLDLSLTIPKGPKGDQGLPGPKGDKGNKGDKGDPGTDGDGGLGDLCASLGGGGGGSGSGSGSGSGGSEACPQVVCSASFNPDTCAVVTTTMTLEQLFSGLLPLLCDLLNGGGSSGGSSGSSSA